MNLGEADIEPTDHNGHNGRQTIWARGLGFFQFFVECGQFRILDQRDIQRSLAVQNIIYVIERIGVLRRVWWIWGEEVQSELVENGAWFVKSDAVNFQTLRKTVTDSWLGNFVKLIEQVPIQIVAAEFFPTP